MFPGEELMKSTVLYSGEVLPLVKKGLVKGIAHITGGGLPGNVCRAIRNDLKASLNAANWNIPPIFSWIAIAGRTSILMRV